MQKCVICIKSDWLDVTSFMYLKQCSHHQYINCFSSLPTSILKGCIKIDYHMHLKLSVEMLFLKHYSDSEIHLKIILPYINTLCIGSLHKKQSIIISCPPLFFLNIGTANKQYTNDGLMIYAGIVCTILVDKSHFEWLIQEMPYKTLNF